MRVKEFAQAKNVTPRTVSTWLRDGIVPGATLHKFPDGQKQWDIPIVALSMVVPKRGRVANRSVRTKRGRANARKGAK